MRGWPGAFGLPIKLPAFLLENDNSNKNNKTNTNTVCVHLLFSRCCAKHFTLITL